MQLNFRRKCSTSPWRGFTARVPRPSNALRSFAMEHSQAVMEDAGKSLAAGEREAAKRTGDTVDSAAEGKRHHDARHGKKRAGDWASDRQQYGSRGGGDGRGGRHDGKRAKKGGVGLLLTMGYIPFFLLARRWWERRGASCVYD